MKQVFSKTALGDKLAQIAIRCRNHPNICLDRFIAADPANSVVFQDGQNFGLQRRRETRQFVQEEGSAVAGFEQPHARGPGVSKGTALMSEKLRFC